MTNDSSLSSAIDSNLSLAIDSSQLMAEELATGIEVGTINAARDCDSRSDVLRHSLVRDSQAALQALAQNVEAMRLEADASFRKATAPKPLMGRGLSNRLTAAAATGQKGRKSVLMRKGSGLGGGKGFDGDANGTEDGDGDGPLVALTHDQRMIELDREKYRLAGQVSELELEIGNLQSEISRLRSELGSSGSASNNNANNSNNGNNNSMDDNVTTGIATMELNDFPSDETSLKLEIYRNLGVEMVADDTGTFTKARVTSPPPRNEVHLIQFNDKYSASFYSERLWNIIT